MSDMLKHGQGKDHSPTKGSALLPEFRSVNKSKWKDQKSSGFLPSYKDFGRKTLNGFHTISRGKITEKNGSPVKLTEVHNPYINSHFDIGHKFRRRVSQKEMSEDEFRSHTSNDVMMKSTYSSMSIRSIESQSAFNLAQATLERLEPLHNPYGRNPAIRIHFKTLENDSDVQSPKMLKRLQVQSNRYKGSKKGVGRINLDMNLTQFSSSRSIDT